MEDYGKQCMRVGRRQRKQFKERERGRERKKLVFSKPGKDRETERKQENWDSSVLVRASASITWDTYKLTVYRQQPAERRSDLEIERERGRERETEREAERVREDERKKRNEIER